MEREIPIETPAGSMKTFIAHPDGDGPFPVGVIYMDAPGYRRALLDVARRYASAGYFVVVPDLYHGFGEDITISIATIGEEGPGGPEMRRMFELVGRLTPEMGATFTQAMLEQLDTEPAAGDGPKGALGFCMGARHVLHTLATFPERFVAGSGIHPGVLVSDADDSPHRELGRLRGELYLGFASDDEASSPHVLAALEDEARGAGATLRIEVYPGTRHGFAMVDTPVYQAEAAERHYTRTLELWGRLLRG